MDTDEALIGAVAAGDADALRHLYERHAAAVLRLLRRLTGQLPEDLLQETWVAVWQSAGSYRGDSSVRGWILGVARRQAHNVLRRKGLPTVDLYEAAAVADSADPVDVQVLAAMGHETLVAAVRALPLIHREVVALALIEGLPYRDIAEVLGVPVGTVKSRVSAARARLMSELREMGVQR